MARAREARSGTPIELQPQEAPLIAGREVLFSSPEYAPSTVRFPGVELCHSQIDPLACHRHLRMRYPPNDAQFIGIVRVRFAAHYDQVRQRADPKSAWSRQNTFSLARVLNTLALLLSRRLILRA
jgi:hypothetical protein